MSNLLDWATAVMSPSPWALIVAILVTLLIPVILHQFVFHASGLTTLPSILVVGPSGSGKTSLLTMVSLLEILLFTVQANRLVRTRDGSYHPYISNIYCGRMFFAGRHKNSLKRVSLSQ